MGLLFSIDLINCDCCPQPPRGMAPFIVTQMRGSVAIYGPKGIFHQPVAPLSAELGIRALMSQDGTGRWHYA